MYGEAIFRASPVRPSPCSLDLVTAIAPARGDIGAASPFVNYQLGGGTIDPAKYPRLASFVERIHARPSFKGFIAEDQGFVAKLRG